MPDKESSPTKESESQSPKTVVFVDIDGVIGARFLRVSPQSDGNPFTPLQEKHLVSLRQQVAKLSEAGTQVILSTGRAIEETAIIADKMGVGQDICENGAVLVKEGEKIILLPEELKPAADFLSQTASAHFAKDYQLIKKETMCTIQIPDQIRSNPEAVNQFQQSIWEEMKTLTDFSKFKSYIIIGHSSEAVDITVAWDKGKGVAAYLDRFCERGKTKSFSLGDSQPDIAMMQETDFAACPQDAQADVKKYLETKPTGSFLISSFPLSLGAMEIFHQIEQMAKTDNWSFSQSQKKAKAPIITRYKQQVRS